MNSEIFSMDNNVSTDSDELFNPAVITLDGVIHVEDNYLNLHEKISLVFLLYDVPDHALQTIKTLVLNQNDKSTVISDWARASEVNPIELTWKYKLLESLISIQNFQSTCSFGISKDNIQLYIDSQDGSFLNRIRKELFLICENLPLEAAEQLLTVAKGNLTSFDEFCLSYPRYLELFFLHLISFKIIAENHSCIDVKYVCALLRAIDRPSLSNEIEEVVHKIEIENNLMEEVICKLGRDSNEEVVCKLEKESNITKEVVCDESNLTYVKNQDLRIQDVENENKQLELNDILSGINKSNSELILLENIERSSSRSSSQSSSSSSYSSCSSSDTEVKSQPIGSSMVIVYTDSSSDESSLGDKKSDVKMCDKISNNENGASAVDMTEDKHTKFAVKPVNTVDETYNEPKNEGQKQSFLTFEDQSVKYPMDSSAPHIGLCLVINNYKFVENEYYQLEERHGSNWDVKKLKNTFQDTLGMEFLESSNVRSLDFIHVIKSRLEMKFRPDYSVFVLCILSHGTKVPDIVSDGHADERDFFKCMSTIPGRGAYRDQNLGSWFIQELCTAISKNWKQKHFMEIITVVNSKIHEIQDYLKLNNIYVGEKEMVPIFTCTGTKLLYFY
uniref:Caspase family p20 domain-containing protein n=1 Tax=Clastoptera arizonana TaxID=38151 RepID=A0A1B6E754_9HEMI